MHKFLMQTHNVLRAGSNELCVGSCYMFIFVVAFKLIALLWLIVYLQINDDSYNVQYTSAYLHLKGTWDIFLGAPGLLQAYSSSR